MGAIILIIHLRLEHGLGYRFRQPDGKDALRSIFENELKGDRELRKLRRTLGY